MNLVKCEICGGEIPNSLKKCPKCGSTLKGFHGEGGFKDRIDILILVAAILFTLSNFYVIVSNFENFSTSIEEFFNTFDFYSFGMLVRALGSILQNIFPCIALWSIFFYVNKKINAFKWISLISIIFLPIWTIVDFILYWLVLGGTVDFKTLLLVLYYIISYNPVLLVAWFLANKLNNDKN